MIELLLIHWMGGDDGHLAFDAWINNEVLAGVLRDGLDQCADVSIF